MDITKNYPHLIHETSLGIALDIIRTRCFLGGEIMHDGGVNAEIVNHSKKGIVKGQAKMTGALIKFEWRGPIRVTSSENFYDPDILYDQHQGDLSRCFVPIGSQHLYLIGLELIGDSSWCSMIPSPKFELINPNGWARWLRSKRPQWLNHEASNLEKEITDIIKKHDRIKITFPPHCSYEYILREKYPNIPA